MKKWLVENTERACSIGFWAGASGFMGFAIYLAIKLHETGIPWLP